MIKRQTAYAKPTAHCNTTIHHGLNHNRRQR